MKRSWMRVRTLPSWLARWLSRGRSRSSRNSPSSPQPAGGAANNDVYIVQMVQAPVVAYAGGIDNLRATKPRRGQKIDPNSPMCSATWPTSVTATPRRSTRWAAQEAVRLPVHLQRLRAVLTATQATAMRAFRACSRVERRAPVRGYDNYATFPGLDASNGLWAQLGARKRGRGNHHRHRRLRYLAGEFRVLRSNRAERERVQERQAGLPTDSRMARQVHARRGVQCVDVQPELIGAQWFNQGYNGDAGIDADLPWNSPPP